MSQVEAPNYLRKWEFGDSACYAELPKVADAVIEATEAIDDSLIANRVTLALYSDKEVHGRGIRVKSAQGVVELTGVVASTAEAQRAEEIAQQVKGVKAVRNRLKVQKGRPDPAPRTPSSTGKTRL